MYLLRLGYCGDYVYVGIMPEIFMSYISGRRKDHPATEDFSGHG